jgi:hypothetical protein
MPDLQIAMRDPKIDRIRSTVNFARRITNQAGERGDLRCPHLLI